MKTGKLITIEGTEGAGKSTALNFIKDYLTQHQISVVLTREPGGTPIAEEIRQVLLHPKSAEIVTPETELLLMFAGRAQHIAQIIRPALERGDWVVSDRYIDATYAYQGGGRGMNEAYIQSLDKLIVNALYPHLTLLLDVPAEMGCERALKRGNKKDRIEKEQIDFFARVRQAYLERAKDQPKRIKVVDASLPVDEVIAQIEKFLANFIRDHS